MPLPPDLPMPPFETQRRAAAVTRQMQTTRFKGMILADIMGGGKTISALLGGHALLQDVGKICLYVTPAACCRQVMAQIREFFGGVRTFPLLARDDTVC